MSSIYLLRHAEYDNPDGILPGRLPVVLSDEGRQQAARLKAYFADKQIGLIYSSAVERCKQTAEIISGGNIVIQYDQRLLEALSAYQGYRGENWNGSGYHFFSHVPELGGETFAGIRARMADFWDEIMSEGLSENVIICSHGEPIQLLYAHIQSLPTAPENASGSDIPGWINKAAFIEVICVDGKVQTVQAPVELA